jgi:hypothetical protein
VKHKCEPMRYCTCSVVGLEPDEDCAIHGVDPMPRCQCGRFVKSSAANRRVVVKPAYNVFTGEHKGWYTVEKWGVCFPTPGKAIAYHTERTTPPDKETK